MSDVKGMVVAVTMCALVGSGCSYLSFAADDSPWQGLEVLAVLPIREVPQTGGDPDRPSLGTHAGRAVRAQVYGVLAEQTRYRFLPDLTVDDLVDVPGDGDLLASARELARAAEADGVLFGTVYRFQERVGPRYAASAPASVSFELALYSTEADEVIWRGQFDETQEALSSNILNAWMFWRAGAHWFTARELTRLGVEKLLGEIS